MPDPETTVPFDADDRSSQFAAVLADASRAGDDPETLRSRADDLLPPIDLDDASCRRLLDLGAELDALFGLDPDTTVARLDAALAALRVRPRLVTHDGRPLHLHFERDGADPLERIRVNTTMGLARTVTTDGPDRLGRCEATGCDDVFVDLTRAGRRRFCGAACANRTHVAAHRARRAQVAATSVPPAART